MPETIAIVGLGLMGGSLAAAVRKRFPSAKVIGISRSRRALGLAKKRGWIHQGFSEINKESAEADLIILCTPVDVFPATLGLLERVCRPGTVVTDVGSVKGELLRWYGSRKWNKISWVSAHPMVGSHERGIDAVRPGLYSQGYTFLIRGKAGSLKAYSRVRSFWKKISARVIEISAAEHDRIVAGISHVPHAVAAALVLGTRKEIVKFASTGFKDTTRIAAGDPSIWVPILISNRKEAIKSLAAFEKNLHALRKAIVKKSRKRLRDLLARAAVLRAEN